MVITEIVNCTWIVVTMMHITVCMLYVNVSSTSCAKLILLSLRYATVFLCRELSVSFDPNTNTIDCVLE